MKFNLPVNNFAAGEWSDRMKGRVDTEQYVRACEDLTNMIPQMTGGAEYRAGTYITEMLSEVGYAEVNALIAEGVTNLKIVPYTPTEVANRRILLILPHTMTLTPKWKNLGTGIDLTYTGATSTARWNPALS